MFENLPTYNLKITVWINLFKNTCTLSLPNSDLLCMLSAKCCLHAYHNKEVLPTWRTNPRLFTDKPIWEEDTPSIWEFACSLQRALKIGKKNKMRKNTQMLYHIAGICVFLLLPKDGFWKISEPVASLAFTSVCLWRTVNRVVTSL